MGNSGESVNLQQNRVFRGYLILRHFYIVFVQKSLVFALFIDLEIFLKIRALALKSPAQQLDCNYIFIDPLHTKTPRSVLLSTVFPFSLKTNVYLVLFLDYFILYKIFFDITKNLFKRYHAFTYCDLQLRSRECCVNFVR